MAFLKITFAVGVIICITLLECTFAIKHVDLRKRAVGSAPEVNKKEPQPQPTPGWKPATGPREFTVNVDDNIHGANQHRHEKWNNGTVTGTYAAPGRNGKWLKYEYVGDSNGFRIISTKEVTPDELMMDGNAAAKDNQANVNINQDQATPVKYTVTEEQLAKSKDKSVGDKQKGIEKP